MSVYDFKYGVIDVILFFFEDILWPLLIGLCVYILLVPLWVVVQSWIAIQAMLTRIHGYGKAALRIGLHL